MSSSKPLDSGRLVGRPSPVRFGLHVTTPVVPFDALQHGSKSGDAPRPVDALGDNDHDAAVNGHGDHDAAATNGPVADAFYAAVSGHGNHDAAATNGPA